MSRSGREPVRLFRAGLRLLEQQEKLEALQLEELRVAIRAGIESGPGRPVQDVVARLKAKYQAQIDDSEK